MTKYFIKIAVVIYIVTSVTESAFSQSNTTNNQIELGYKEYLNLVINNNLEYTSEKYNINIADAKIQAAKVFQNPSLSIDWSGNKDGYSLSTELSKTFEIGQKRKARINLAKSERELTNALLNDYLRNLQADATIDYLEAVKQNYLYNVMLSSYKMMKELASADSVRLSLGSIMAIDAAQSKIEEGSILNNLLQIDADRQNSFVNLSNRTSRYNSDTIFMPTGKFDKINRSFLLPNLINTALNNRADLLAARGNITYNQNLLRVTKKERNIDIDFKIGANNAYEHTGIMSPNSTEIFTGIAIPLKFSNFNKGEIKIAKYQVEQAELQFKQVEINIQNEVIKAYNQYLSLHKQVENYNKGLLEQAKTVLNGKIYSYSRGETSLLEVLNSQRTYNDLQTSYFETLYNSYVALVELERAVGIWDIDL